MEVKRATGDVVSLPDNIIFQIFSRLSFKDLGQCALVSKTWRNLSHDPVLWRFMDFRKYSLSVSEIQVILEKRCSDALKSLAIQGLQMEPTAISSNFTTFLSASYSNLTHLHLSVFNFAYVQLSSFPSSLKKLVLNKCMFPENFFDKLREETIFPKLEHLDISMNVGLSDHHLECISHLKTLKALIMKQNRNHDVTNLGAKHLAKLKNIRSLDVANTGITDEGMDVVVSALPYLKTLNISMLKLSNLTITAIANYSKCLEILMLNQVFGVTDIMPLVDLPYISYINVNNTSVERDTVTDFRKIMPKCLVDFQFQRYLSQHARAITVSDGRFCI